MKTRTATRHTVTELVLADLLADPENGAVALAARALTAAGKPDLAAELAPITPDTCWGEAFDILADVVYEARRVAPGRALTDAEDDAYELARSAAMLAATLECMGGDGVSIGALAVMIQRTIRHPDEKAAHRTWVASRSAHHATTTPKETRS